VPIIPPFPTGGAPSPTPTGDPAATPVVIAPHAHSGWADLRNSLNRHLPTQLVRSQQLGHTTLRILAHHHKVGR
jgi:hypothetical protein